MLKAIATVTLLLGAALGIQAIPVSAASVTKPSTQRPSMGGGSTSGKSVLAQLEAAKHLLEHAKHDYAGHRLKALHEITLAIKDLEHKHPTHSPMAAQGGKAGGSMPVKMGSGKAGGAGGKSTVKAGGGKSGNAGAGDEESQSKSDAQLRKAEQELKAVLKQLHGGNHKKAAKAIEAAIHELQLALKVA
jgi:hypothetical protein